MPLLLRNIPRSPRRTVLTVISIAVSIFIFAALMSLPSLVNQVMRERANSLRLVVGSKAGFFYNLPYAYRHRIQAIRHVDIVSGETIFMATYRDPADQVPAIAIDPERLGELFSDWTMTPQAAGDFARLRTAALVGETLMNRFHWKVGDQITLHGLSQPIDITLDIVGQLGGSAPAFVLVFRRDRLDEALGRPGTVNLFWVKVDTSGFIPAVIQDIDRMFANSASETQSESELTASQNRVSEMRMLFDGAQLLAAIVVVTIGLVATNTAAMAVRERRREMAIMRALGFTRAAVVAIIVGEGLVIGLVGGTIGCAGAYVALKFLPYASRSLGILAYAISMPARNMAGGILIAAAIGIASSFFPAFLATRGDISSQIRAL
ncbi:MAG TPA: FtsX-like permease family protein [Candidatus Binataceae bacterium]|nr:FtsX-like permease family protein [Candidatus Binataceae bacterium]